ncbi:MAG: 50S ribosomal protein L24 [Patescibacteria group bacterium]
MKLRKGDTVIVRIGKDKGKKGKVQSILPKEGKLIVEGINVFKRHMKKKDDKHPAGIIDVTKPIIFSKLSFLCPKCNKAARIGYLIVRQEKIRICKKCEQRI